jgi:ABC-type xylose transport system permease subunit
MVLITLVCIMMQPGNFGQSLERNDMERRIKQEIGISVLFIVFSVIVIFVVSGYQDPMKEQYKTLRSSFVPVLWASILGLLSLMHVVSLFLKSRGEKSKVEDSVPLVCEAIPLGDRDRRKVAVMVGVTAVAMLLYCLLLLKINFIINTMWLLFVTLYAYGERSLIRTVPIAVGGAFGLWFLFVKLMQVPL